LTARLTYSHVKSFIESKGYTLLSKEYVNANTKLTVKCNKGHIWYPIYNNIKNGQGCSICGKQSMIQKMKLTYNEVKHFIESKGYTLLSKEYINANTKLTVKCDKGHIYKVKYGHFQQGHRCAICQGVKKLTYNKVKNYIESKNYSLLSKKYSNNKNKLTVKCDKDHIYKVSFSDFQQGNRCAICQGVKKLTYDFVKNYINSNGYTLLSKKYENNSTKLTIKCNKNHVYKSSFSNFKKGRRCPICNKKNVTSKGERDVAKFITLLNINIIKNDRTQILNPVTGHYLELDIWIPNLNKAIEYNGAYWHSLPNNQINDQIKKEQCKKLNIDLLIIDDIEWNNNQKYQKQIIKEFING